MQAADYGVPQRRRRLFLVGVRGGPPLDTPRPTHARDADPNNGIEKYRTAWDAIGHLDRDTWSKDLACKGQWARLLPSIPEGSNWRPCPTEYSSTVGFAPYVELAFAGGASRGFLFGFALTAAWISSSYSFNRQAKFLDRAVGGSHAARTRERSFPKDETIDHLLGRQQTDSFVPTRNGTGRIRQVTALRLDLDALRLCDLRRTFISLIQVDGPAEISSKSSRKGSGETSSPSIRPSRGWLSAQSREAGTSLCDPIGN